MLKTMTVGELIDALSAHPRDMKVVGFWDGHQWPIVGPRFITRQDVWRRIDGKREVTGAVVTIDVSSMNDCADEDAA